MEVRARRFPEHTSIKTADIDEFPGHRLKEAIKIEFWGEATATPAHRLITLHGAGLSQVMFGCFNINSTVLVTNQQREILHPGNHFLHHLTPKPK